MILWCKENTNLNSPDRIFHVECNGNESASDIARLCGKLPKLYEPRGGDGEWKDWICHTINFTAVDGGWCVEALHRPQQVIVPDPEDDDPQFPPYPGPVGKQPDGSFILSPRAFAYLKAAWLWKGRDKMWKLPNNHFDKFCDVIYEETGWASEELT